MERSEFYTLCEEAFVANGLHVPDEKALAQFFQLTEILLETNQHMNLTAIRDEKGVVLRHFVDSALFMERIPENATVLDVGCGAGFPTFPLAILRPDLRIVAMDATAKRIEYVKQTAKILGLLQIFALACRAEEAAQGEMRETYDVVTARAVAALPVLTELCLPFVRLNGMFMAMKAKQAEDELQQSQNAIRICGGRLENVYTKPLKDTESGLEEDRTAILIRKLSATPQNYPRHFSKISKKPL